MKIGETNELLLNEDAEIDAASYVADRVTKRTKTEIESATLDEIIEIGQNKELAQRFRNRMNEIIMGSPLGSFEKPNVQLTSAETELVLAAAYNFVFVFQEGKSQLFPHVVQKIDELAAEGNAYFFPTTSVVLE